MLRWRKIAGEKNAKHSSFGCSKVSGEANETQIAEALRRYSERAFFVREALFHLFSLTHVMEKTKPEILKVRTKRGEKN